MPSATAKMEAISLSSSAASISDQPSVLPPFANPQSSVPLTTVPLPMSTVPSSTSKKCFVWKLKKSPKTYGYFLWPISFKNGLGHLSKFFSTMQRQILTSINHKESVQNICLNHLAWEQYIQKKYLYSS